MNKLITMALLATVSMTANASNWIAGIGYTKIKTSGEGINVSLPGIQASIGHQFNFKDSHISITPVFSVTKGAGKDAFETAINVGRFDIELDIDIEIKKIESFSVRFQYDTGDSYVFIGPIRSRSEISLQVLDIRATVKGIDTGYIVGGGIDISQNASIEVSFNKIKDVSGLTAQIRFNF